MFGEQVGEKVRLNGLAPPYPCCEPPKKTAPARGRTGAVYLETVPGGGPARG
jgi:hypothetical protein